METHRCPEVVVIHRVGSPSAGNHRDMFGPHSLHGTVVAGADRKTSNKALRWMRKVKVCPNCIMARWCCIPTRGCTRMLNMTMASFAEGWNGRVDLFPPMGLGSPLQEIFDIISPCTSCGRERTQRGDSGVTLPGDEGISQNSRVPFWVFGKTTTDSDKNTRPEYVWY